MMPGWNGGLGNHAQITTGVQIFKTSDATCYLIQSAVLPLEVFKYWKFTNNIAVKVGFAAQLAKFQASPHGIAPWVGLFARR